MTKKTTSGFSVILRDTGSQAQQQSSNDQDDRIWQLQLARQSPKNYDKKEQQQKNKFDCLDIASHHRGGVSKARNLSADNQICQADGD